MIAMIDELKTTITFPGIIGQIIKTYLKRAFLCESVSGQTQRALSLPFYTHTLTLKTELRCAYLFYMGLAMATTFFFFFISFIPYLFFFFFSEYLMDKFRCRRKGIILYHTMASLYYYTHCPC
jgi:hypothetical protein